jgi:hypothetical protein
VSEGKIFDHEAPLDDRKAAILRAIVEEYVETAQPVGSAAIARTTGLGVSSATVRNEMTVLEREGYLAQPHTSAGRVPTVVTVFLSIILSTKKSYPFRSVERYQTFLLPLIEPSKTFCTKPAGCSRAYRATPR